MKIIETSLFKLAKKKKWDPNPWAVCHTTVNKDENPKKYESCVKKIKKKQKKASLIEASLIKEEQNVHTPEMEDEFADQQSNLWKKRKELGLGGPVKRKQRKQLRKGVEAVDPNMDDKGWAKFITKKLKEKDDFSGAPF